MHYSTNFNILPDPEVINLADPPIDQIKINKFPDSQINISITNDVYGNDYVIWSRLSSYEDLFKILATVDVLRHNGVLNIDLFCPYILGARSDCRFDSKGSFDLKIIADIINRLNLNNVMVYDAHSNILPALINNCENVNSYDAFISETGFDWTDKVLISPDAGAYKKVFHLSEKLNVELIPANKVRLKDGSPKLEVYGNVTGKDCVIVDDICDGGRTFIYLGEKLKSMGAKSVTLFVTHGIFSKGLPLQNIDKIYTTNSYQELESTDYLTVINVFE